MALPSFPPIKEEWIPGEAPLEPPLPKWLLHELGLNPVTWIQEPEYREAYEEIASKFGTWAAKRACVVCGRGDVECVRREAEALQLAHLAK